MAKKTAVEQRLDDLADKIDNGFADLKAALREHVADDKSTFKDHDGRITTVEREQWKFSGKTALIAFVLTLLASSVSAAVVSHLWR